MIHCGSLQRILLLLAAASSQGADVRFDVIPARSTIAVRIGKSGVLSALSGHEHGVISNGFSARVCGDPQTLADASVDFRVPVTALRIDTTAARRAAGLSGSGPSAEDVPTIQEKMLSSAYLAAGQHPEIRFESATAQRKEDMIFLQGALTIKGRSNRVSIPLHVVSSENALRFSGKFPIRLTDYGITPESVGGVVKVKDQVTIVVDVLARPTQEGCR